MEYCLLTSPENMKGCRSTTICSSSMRARVYVWKVIIKLGLQDRVSELVKFKCRYYVYTRTRTMYIQAKRVKKEGV